MVAAHTRHDLGPGRVGQEQGKGRVAGPRPLARTHQAAFSMWHRQESSLHLPRRITTSDKWGPCSLLVRLAVCPPTKVPLMSSVKTRLQQQEHASRHISQQNVLCAS